MFAIVYQGKRGKDYWEEVEETSLHLVTGLSYWVRWILD